MELRKGLYQHYKGNYYEVVGTARHSETLEELVVYRALYGNNDLWVRPRAMFLETVVWEGREQARFQLVDSKRELDKQQLVRRRAVEKTPG